MGCETSRMEVTSLVSVPTTTSSSKKNLHEPMTIMLVGAGDSGKTTIRKQLGNSADHRLKAKRARQEFSYVIIGNILDGTLQVLNRTEGGKDSKQLFQRLSKDARSSVSFLSPETAEIILDLWKDPLFLLTLRERAVEVQIQDCYEVFCEKLRDYPAWGGPNWVPSEEECIRCRARTSGLATETFVYNETPLTIVDVGGQRAERKKWLKVTPQNPVDTAIFVCALSEYNQSCFEERNKNRLEESLDLFKECFSQAPLNRIKSCLLFLNKKDVFDRRFNEEKIPFNISGRFPDAPTDQSDPNAAIEYIAGLFRKKRANFGGGSKTLYVHITTATDSHSIKSAFNVSMKQVVQMNMNSFESE